MGIVLEGTQQGAGQGSLGPHEAHGMKERPSRLLEWGLAVDDRDWT